MRPTATMRRCARSDRFRPRSVGSPCRRTTSPRRPGAGRIAPLPEYLLTHSVRAYCWGAAIGAGEGLSFDAPILWTASLMHDVGLTRIPRNTRCFEVEGGEIARRFLERQGVAADTAATVATAIVLHMAPNVTLDDGVEALLLDRATGLDVRGVAFELVDGVRPDVMRDVPARRVRPAVPRRDHPRGRAASGLPERPTAQHGRPGGLDGSIALGDGEVLTVATAKMKAPAADFSSVRSMADAPADCEPWLQSSSDEPSDGATDMNLYTADLMIDRPDARPRPSIRGEPPRRPGARAA